MGSAPVFTPSGWSPRLHPLAGIQAVIFDVYGTLLLGGGPVKADTGVEAGLDALLQQWGLRSPGYMTHALAEAVARHHHLAEVEFPEVDLRALWSEILNAEVTDALLVALENVRQSVVLMPGAREALDALRGIPLGLISNAQANTVPVLEINLGDHLFLSDLCVLSYQHGIAKPSPRLYAVLVAALERRGISPQAAVIVGNDPRHDILPAKALGFRTVLMAADHDSLREGNPNEADAVITDLRQLAEIVRA